MGVCLRFIIIVFFSLLLFSCLTTSSFQIEVIEPVDNAIPKYVTNVTLIGNNFLPKDGSVLPKTISDNKSIYVDDSLLDVSLKTFKSILLESPKFLEGSIVNYKLIELEEASHRGCFNWEFVENVCEITKSNGLISLEFLGFDNRIEFIRMYENSIENFKILTVKSFGIWKFYDISTKKISEYVYKDTLIWSSINNYGVSVQIPTIDEAYIEAAKIAGEVYARRIAPSWVMVDRLYFISGNKEMKRNLAFVDSSDWVGMAELCEKYVDSPKINLASKAAYNMALVSEMEGKLDLAHEWLVKAFNISSNHYFKTSIKQYMEVIKMRKKDVLLIEKQL